jgi:hypothetical protein
MLQVHELKCDSDLERSRRLELEADLRTAVRNASLLEQRLLECDATFAGRETADAGVATITTLQHSSEVELKHVRAERDAEHAALEGAQRKAAALQAELSMQAEMLQQLRGELAAAKQARDADLQQRTELCAAAEAKGKAQSAVALQQAREQCTHAEAAAAAANEALAVTRAELAAAQQKLLASDAAAATCRAAAAEAAAACETETAALLSQLSAAVNETAALKAAKAAAAAASVTTAAADKQLQEQYYLAELALARQGTARMLQRVQSLTEQLAALTAAEEESRADSTALRNEIDSLLEQQASAAAAARAAAREELREERRLRRRVVVELDSTQQQLRKLEAALAQQPEQHARDDQPQPNAYE